MLRPLDERVFSEEGGCGIGGGGRGRSGSDASLCRNRGRTGVGREVIERKKMNPRLIRSEQIVLAGGVGVELPGEVLIFFGLGGVGGARRGRLGQTSTDRFPTNIGPLSNCFPELFCQDLCIREMTLCIFRHDTSVHPA